MKRWAIYLLFIAVLASTGVSGQPRNGGELIMNLRYFYFFDNSKLIVHCAANKNYRIIETYFDSLNHQKHQNEFSPCENCSDLFCLRKWFFTRRNYDKCVLTFIRNDKDTMKVIIPYSEYDNSLLDTIRFQKGVFNIPVSIR
jgi:hypothetical protein